jgi:hypothetical protein
VVAPLLAAFLAFFVAVFLAVLALFVFALFDAGLARAPALAFFCRFAG